MDYARLEYLTYRETYIDGQAFKGNARVLWKSNISKVDYYIVIHAHDNYEETTKGCPHFKEILRLTIRTLNSIFKTKRQCVHRFAVIGDKIYLDPWFSGVEDSSVFHKSVFINREGINKDHLSNIGKLIIRLGGYVIDEEKFYTQIRVKCPSLVTKLDVSSGKCTTPELLLMEYEDYYGKSFNLEVM